MTFYLVLFISFFLVAISIRQLRAAFYSLAKNSVSLVNELIADHDEDEKIKQIQQKTNRLVVSLLKMFLVVFLALAIGSIPVLIYVHLTDSTLAELDFSSFYAILSISLGATIPFIIPFSNKPKSNYSELSRLLHEMALDNYFLSNKLFKRETNKIKKKKTERQKRFVIISGLARAGTTSLMNDLSKIDDFVSLSYANMPFLMAPNLWAKIYKPKNEKLKERSHQDGIMIGLNSNEALEEYFFKVKANDSYIKNDRLAEYQVSEEDYLDYLDYHRVIKNNKPGQVYLAKNNNFILRYNSVRTYNDDFIMVILYRDPQTHVASLLEKHNLYTKLQGDDPFVLKYMNWLGHHEFGLNQKPFVFSDTENFSNTEMVSVDYWIKSWINYYQYVLNIDHPNTIFINYDLYCENPKATIQSILKKTGIESSLPDYTPFNNPRKNDFEIPVELFKTSKEVYNQLCSR